LALCGVLLLIDRTMRLRPGRLLAVYVAGYAVGRFWVEGLRIDPANHGGGWRLNQWTAVIGFAGAVAFLAIDALRHRGDEGGEQADEQADEQAGEPLGDGPEEPIDEPDPVDAAEPDYVPENE
jgi:prolipoprotein diacylglyceryltransferase